MAMHNRKLVFSGIALVMGRLKNSGKIYESLRNYLEELIIKSDFLKDAPFEWIGAVFRYGIKNNLKVEFQKISKKYGDITIALELDMEILKWADQHNLDLLHDIFMVASLEALMQLGQKYNLPIDAFISERKKYGQIPNNIDECKAYTVHH